MPFSLLQLSVPELQELAASRIPPHLAPRLVEDALPPSFVAARSLELAAAGHPLPWSTTFLIVRSSDHRIVGGCGFKTAPEHVLTGPAGDQPDGACAKSAALRFAPRIADLTGLLPKWL